MCIRDSIQNVRDPLALTWQRDIQAGAFDVAVLKQLTDQPFLINGQPALDKSCLLYTSGAVFLCVYHADMLAVAVYLGALLTDVGVGVQFYGYAGVA